MEVVLQEDLSPGPAQAFAGLLGRPLNGHALPALWHWIYLLDRPRQDELAQDGHPRIGIPTPPAPGLMRMFAGGSCVRRRPLLIGESAQRRSWVSNTSEKVGRSGPLTFVTVRSEYSQHGTVALVDETRLIYRKPEPLRSVSSAEGPAAPAPSASTSFFDVDPVVLFRFSALTYNSHRIHYDRDFALSEGHPDLVIHGPLQAVLMAQYLYDDTAGEGNGDSEFDFRLVAPAYGSQRLSLRERAQDRAGSHGAEVRDATGRVTATASLRTRRP